MNMLRLSFLSRSVFKVSENHFKTDQQGGILMSSLGLIDLHVNMLHVGAERLYYPCCVSE